MTNNTILETTYELLSGHIIMTVVQKLLKVDKVKVEVKYTVLLNTLTMKQLTTSLYLINDSLSVHFNGHFPDEPN